MLKSRHKRNNLTPLTDSLNFNGKHEVSNKILNTSAMQICIFSETVTYHMFASNCHWTTDCGNQRAEAEILTTREHSHLGFLPPDKHSSQK